jgi:hypothetical protein
MSMTKVMCKEPIVGSTCNEGNVFERAETRMSLDTISTLYHFTDRRNLASIRESGGLYSWAKLQEMGVEVEAPGGDDWSHNADAMKGLDAYVHLCFRGRHPMEYRARLERRIVESVFLRIDPAVLEIEGVMCTDDVSNKSGVELYSIDDAAERIDFEVLCTYQDWNDPGIKERLRQAEKCEILVPDVVPIDLIRNLSSVAERPIFIPCPTAPGLVNERLCQFVWNAGLAPSQKRKNIRALHEAAAAVGYSPLLEVSTKSDEKLGQHLSAFNLKVRRSWGEIPLESAFQGSKVFEGGGPYTDLYSAEPRAARRDPRLQDSGRLLRFNFDNSDFPLNPKTAFYDWLYVKALFPHREWLARLEQYAGFTDIEFNPQRSINCQARSCALFVALRSNNLLERALQSPESFLELMSDYTYLPQQV